MDYSQLHNHQLAFDADTQTAHPCSQPQDQLGSLFETHEIRNSLYHHGHKLLHFPILLNVFLPYDLPDVRIRQLQRRCHKAKGGQGKGTWKRVWKHYVAQCGSYCAVMRPIFFLKKVISGIHTHKLSTNPPCVSDSKLASFGHRKTSDVVPFVGLCHCCL